jgi:acyl dehydratase
MKTFPPITREQLRAYAEASGDPNPVHLDDEAAKKAGLPGIIAHGMLVAAFVARAAEELGGRELATLRTRFRAMTLVGDTLSVAGTPKGDALELVATNQRGETVVTAVARFRALSASGSS